MPIQLDSQDCKHHCLKYLWSIKDDPAFVRCIAQLALGQHRHVIRVLQGLGATNNAYSIGKSEVEDLIKRLGQNKPGQVENRDGWLFQLISWVALAIQSNQTTFIDPPHPMESQKGFDGLCISVSQGNNSLDYVMVTEDKATDSPRSVFRNEVLPEIKRIEGGETNSQLRSRVSVLVSLAVTDEKTRESALQAALWQNILRFRTCFATDADGLPKRVELFKGYADAAPGVIERRQGDVLIVNDLRPWFEDLAKKVIAELKQMRTTPHV